MRILTRMIDLDIHQFKKKSCAFSENQKNFPFTSIFIKLILQQNITVIILNYEALHYENILCVY